MAFRLNNTMLPGQNIARYSPLFESVLRFPKNQNTFVQAETPVQWRSAGSFTATIWFYCDHIPTVERSRAISPALPQGALFGIDDATTGGLACWLDGTGAVKVSMQGTTLSLSPLRVYGGWNFIAVVYDSNALTLSLFLDRGRQIQTVALSGPRTITTSGQLYIGRLSSTVQVPYFWGRLARMGLYNEALSVSKLNIVSRERHFGPGKTSYGNMIGCWRMNEGYGSIAYNYATASNYDGVLGGGNSGSAPVWIFNSPNSI